MVAIPSPDIKKSPEYSFTGAEIVDFSNALRKNIDLALKGEQIGDSRELSEGIIPGFASTSERIVEQSQSFIPKEPLHAVIWAISGIRLSGAKLALERYEGSFDEIEALQPLAKGESIKVSKKDMKDVGKTLGQLLANHGLAGRRLTQLKPHLGDLGHKRSELFEAGNMNELRLLDTILQTLSKPKLKKQK